MKQRKIKIVFGEASLHIETNVDLLQREKKTKNFFLFILQCNESTKRKCLQSLLFDSVFYSACVCVSEVNSLEFWFSMKIELATAEHCNNNNNNQDDILRRRITNRIQYTKMIVWFSIEL